MKITSKIQIITIFSILALFATFSRAAIIDFDSYFTDTESGLSWLDVTATVNRSYSDISSQLGTGGEFEGWRYATSDEFNSLLSSWTGITPNFSGRTLTTGTTPSVDGLVMLFGSTLDSLWLAQNGQTFDSAIGRAEGDGVDYTLGILADFFENDSNQRQVAAIWDNDASSSIDFYHTEHRQLAINDLRGEIGSFLVRSGLNDNSDASPVTEPKIILLLCFGIVGIFLSRRNALAH